MILTKRRWIGLSIGIAVFLVAFGVAFAAVWVQGVLTVPSSVKVQTAAIVSGDTMWMLWKDKEMTTPLSSGDGPYLVWSHVTTQPPLRTFSRTRVRPFYLENISGKFARPIEPCKDFLIAATYNAHVNAEFWALNPDAGEGNFRGDACRDGFPGDWFMKPGELWLVQPFLDVRSEMPDGEFGFEIQVGGVGVTGDASSEFVSGD